MIESAHILFSDLCIFNNCLSSRPISLLLFTLLPLPSSTHLIPKINLFSVDPRFLLLSKK